MTQRFTAAIPATKHQLLIKVSLGLKSLGLAQEIRVSGIILG